MYSVEIASYLLAVVVVRSEPRLLSEMLHYEVFLTPLWRKIFFNLYAVNLPVVNMQFMQKQYVVFVDKDSGSRLLNVASSSVFSHYLLSSTKLIM